jgi:hypothetical protein
MKTWLSAIIFFLTCSLAIAQIPGSPIGGGGSSGGAAPSGTGFGYVSSGAWATPHVMSGDCTFAASTGAITCVSISGQKFTLAAGAPTSTNGSVGDYYTDSTNKCLYMATTAGTPATWSQIYCYAADGAKYIGAYNTTSNPTCTSGLKGMLATVGSTPALQLCDGSSWGAVGSGTLSASGTPTNHQWAGWTSATAIKGFTVTSSKPVCTDSSGDPAVCAGTEGVWLATNSLLQAEYDNGTCTTAKTISAANGPIQKVTLTNGQTCALTFTQPSSGTMDVQLKIIQSASSSYNGVISGCKWPSAVVPTITATTGAIDIIKAYMDGTTTYCTVKGQDLR